MYPRFLLPYMPTALLVAALFTLAGCTTPHHVYLTWQNDPHTTMTVNFHSPDHYEDLRLYYDTTPRDGALDAYAFHTTGRDHQINGLRDGRHIYHIEASDLDPGVMYHFILAADGEALTEELRFRPLPPKNAPIRFISGGDMSILPRAEQLTRLAGETDPMFGLIGGDIAYANGRLKNAWMWDRWLNTWEETMKTSDGVMVPLVLAIGNHEVTKEQGSREANAPFYYGYFPQGGLPYFVRRLRDDTVLVVLDSGHSVPHDGDQAEWLDRTLADAADTRNTIAIYHAPLYPSHRDFDDFRAVAGRDSWLPIFDRHGLRVALENHDHTFKRTKVLRDNQVSENGTVYLGDGCFGINPRDIPEPDRWYLEKASGTPHFWLVDIDDDGMHFQAISHAEEILDEISFE